MHTCELLTLPHDRDKLDKGGWQSVCLCVWGVHMHILGVCVSGGGWRWATDFLGSRPEQNYSAMMYTECRAGGLSHPTTQCIICYFLLQKVWAGLCYCLKWRENLYRILHCIVLKTKVFLMEEKIIILFIRNLKIDALTNPGEFFIIPALLTIGRELEGRFD